MPCMNTIQINGVSSGTYFYCSVWNINIVHYVFCWKMPRFLKVININEKRGKFGFDFKTEVLVLINN